MISDQILFEEQKEALQKMKNGCILCGEGGSGKSITGLSYYEKLYTADPKLQLYIITTAKKRDDGDWIEEMERFGFAATVDSWNNIKKYVDTEGAFFIFDEDRVTGSGVWVKAFLKITRKNQWILLSATPGDTWSDYVPVFIANGYFRNRSQFFREHAVFNQFTKYPKIEKYISTGKLNRMRESILVRMEVNRHTVQHHIPIRTDYDSDIYRHVVKDRWNVWENSPIVNAAELCYCMRKVSNIDISRQKAVLDITEKHPKCLIFYNFDYELDILKSLPYGTYTDYCAIAEWNGHHHDPIPNTERWVYLVQYAAGAEGWNCVQTDTVIFFSLNYSYKTMMQASWRIDRKNTPFVDLYYYHLFSCCTIDSAIRETLKEKKKFNELAFLEKYRFSYEKRSR